SDALHGPDAVVAAAAAGDGAGGGTGTESAHDLYRDRARVMDVDRARGAGGNAGDVQAGFRGRRSSTGCAVTPIDRPAYHPQRHADNRRDGGAQNLRHAAARRGAELSGAGRAAADAELGPNDRRGDDLFPDRAVAGDVSRSGDFFRGVELQPARLRIFAPALAMMGRRLMPWRVALLLYALAMANITDFTQNA